MEKHALEKTDNFLEKLSNVDNEYRPVPFWFINHYIREDLIRHQIREMSEKGYGGIMFHGRDGLRSGYLEKEWEDGLNWAIDEAEKHGMFVWLYDENHYPSGPVGNTIFKKYPENTMMNLEVLEEKIIAPDESFSYSIPETVNIKFALVFSEDGEIQSLDCQNTAEQFEWKNITNQSMTILLLHINRQWPIPGQYFPFYPDYLDAEVSKEFIDMTYSWYVERFKEKMGTTIKGVFTDNSCFNFGLIRRSIAWTPKMVEQFKQQTGLELTSVLPGIFCRIKGYERIRQLFWRFLGDEYLRTFVHPIRDICSGNQLDATGHYCLEDGLGEHIRQIGDRFDLKRGQTLSCVDMLGHDVGEDLFENKHFSLCAQQRGTADAAYYHNGSRVMCECLGLMGGWKLDLGEIKRVTGLLATQGIDIFVPHGMYYSVAGTRKWECIPDHYHNPMWNYYREWTDWMAKISFLMAYSDRVGEVALLHPATTLRSYIDIGIENDSTNDSIETSDRGKICDLVDFTCRMAVNKLVQNNIEFDIIDECFLQSAKIKNHQLVIKSGTGTKRALSIIILPHCKVLEEKSIAILKQFRDAGGKVITLNNPVENSYNPQSMTFSAIPENELPGDQYYDFDVERVTGLIQMVDYLCEYVQQPVMLSTSSDQIVSRVWKKWDQQFFMLHNASNESVKNVQVKLACAQEPFLIDLDTNLLKKIVTTSAERHEFNYDFSPGETLILVSGTDLNPVEESVQIKCSSAKKIPVDGQWEFKLLKDNVLPLRDGQLKNIDSCQRHMYNFQIRDLPERIHFIIDREMTKSELLCNQYSPSLKCTVNGKAVENLRPGSYVDYFMFEADITALVNEGENQLCLEYSSPYLEMDRKFHASFIIGPFQLVTDDDSFSIGCLKKTINTGDWGEQGYPFYAGETAYNQTIDLPDNCQGKRLVLSLGELANASEVLINGLSLGRRVLPPWSYDITRFNTEESLNLEIRIINTQQNLFCLERITSGLLGPVNIEIYDE